MEFWGVWIVSPFIYIYTPPGKYIDGDRHRTWESPELERSYASELHPPRTACRSGIGSTMVSRTGGRPPLNGGRFLVTSVNLHDVPPVTSIGRLSIFFRENVGPHVVLMMFHRIVDLPKRQCRKKIWLWFWKWTFRIFTDVFPPSEGWKTKKHPETWKITDLFWQSDVEHDIFAAVFWPPPSRHLVWSSMRVWLWNWSCKTISMMLIWTRISRGFGWDDVWTTLPEV